MKTRYLIFVLGEQHYGLDILHVQELRSYEEPTRMPDTAPHILGVTNLRGVIVGVHDLRKKWGLPHNYNASTITMVLQLEGSAIAFVVDSVSDVIEIDQSTIQDIPFNEANTNGITGVVQHEHFNVLIVDPLLMKT